MEILRLARQLNKQDLPTFGRPTIAMLAIVINAGYPPVHLPFFGLKGKGAVVVVKF
jgi:hypothetical protein